MVSQIDIAPTLLGLMNFEYQSSFFGNDVINNEKNIQQRAFFGTYDKVGHLIDKKLYVLLLKKQYKVFDVASHKFGWQGSEEQITAQYSQQNLDKTINYYRAANYLFSNNLLKKDVGKSQKN